MARTTVEAVQAILGTDYDSVRAPSLVPRIETAAAIVDRVATCASAKDLALSATELELIERWLAAHYYTRSDPTYSSRSTAGASGSFVRHPTVPEPYLASALELDYSGCLKAILSRQTAGGFWAGKPPSEQTAYLDRD